MKVCSKCRMEKDRVEFGVDRKRKDGLHPQCKSCRRANYLDNKPAILEDRKKYYQKNKETIIARVSDYRKNNKEVIRTKARLYSQKKVNEIAAYQREYRLKNIKTIREKERAYYHKNAKERSRRSLPYQIEWTKKRRKSDPLFALSGRIRAAVNKNLRFREVSKSKRTHEYIGCSWPELFSHIERQFTDGMSWENRKQWHIDHIVPLATAKTVDDLIPLFHFTNLRPLWAKDNIEKSDSRTLLI